MKQLQYTVALEIFQKFPKFKRGVLVCSNVCNTGTHTLNYPDVMLNLNITSDNIAESESVAEWRKAFRMMGLDPTKERVSFEGLTRRLLNNNAIRFINPVVDLGNYFSILYQCPVGAHPLIGEMVIIDLKKAEGNEQFNALGGKGIETVEQDEVVLTDGINILTRRFCWRQGTSSLVTSDTTDLFVNFDFISDIKISEIQTIIKEFEDTLKETSTGMTTHSFILEPGSEKHTCNY